MEDAAAASIIGTSSPLLSVEPVAAGAKQQRVVSKPRVILLKRSVIRLRLRSDGTAHARDSFGIDPSQQLTTSGAVVANFGLQARPLPVSMDQGTLAISSKIPLAFYRVDEPFWHLTPGSVHSRGIIGETVRITGKNLEWVGTLLESTKDVLVVYNSERRTASVIRNDKVASVDVQEVAKDDASFFGRSNMCMIVAKQNVSLTASNIQFYIQQEDIAELNYQLGELSYTVHHFIELIGREQNGTLYARIKSVAEIVNQTGIDLTPVVVELVEKRKDVVDRPHQQQQQRGVYYGRRSAKMSRSRGGGGEEEESAEPQAPAAMVAMAQGGGGMAYVQDLSKEQTVNEDDPITLADGLKTNMIVTEIEKLPVRLRYVYQMGSAPSLDEESTVTCLNGVHYSDTSRVLDWVPLRDVAKPLFSGRATVYDGALGSPSSSPMNEQPVNLNGWMEIQGRIRLDLGPTGAVKCRSFVEREMRDTQAKIRTTRVRTELLVYAKTAGLFEIKLELYTEQTAAMPEIVGMYTRNEVLARALDRQAQRNLLCGANLYEQTTQEPNAEMQRLWKRAAQRDHPAVVKHINENERGDVDHYKKDLALQVVIRPEDLANGGAVGGEYPAAFIVLYYKVEYPFA